MLEVQLHYFWTASAFCWGCEIFPWLL